MKCDKNLTKQEKAEKDYVSGMKIKDIAEKYGVTENTVKSWRKRYGWKRTPAPQKGCKGAEIIIDGMTLDEIKEDLLIQLENKNKKNPQNIILVNLYINFVIDYFKYKRDEDKRGHIITWKNGSQQGTKKNESSELKIKASIEARAIMDRLELDSPKVDDDNEI